MPDRIVEDICRPYLDRVSTDGELEHPLRRQLHDELQRAVGQDQWRSYTRLSAACAVKAWPVWRSRFTEDLPFASPCPEATLENPALSLTEHRGELNVLNTFLDNKMRLGHEYFPAVAAGLACWAVNRDVLAGGFLADPELSEMDMDSEDWEPSFFASVAIAGGAAWEESGNPEVRRKFWYWYLEDAVPRAYSIFRRHVPGGT
ncbi:MULTISPECIES: Imm5 family immunity protein [unclassified Streptomyces]|uniref:Imm5 family immunity protein n=1 Tax=unclassified Streptomyces TaxID=2593676 RepID=UPI003864F6C0